MSATLRSRISVFRPEICANRHETRDLPQDAHGEEERIRLGFCDGQFDSRENDKSDSHDETFVGAQSQSLLNVQEPRLTVIAPTTPMAYRPARSSNCVMIASTKIGMQPWQSVESARRVYSSAQMAAASRHPGPSCRTHRLRRRWRCSPH